MKSNYQKLLKEELWINGNSYASIGEGSSVFETKAKGAENLNKDLSGNNISILRYMDKNTNLEANEGKRYF